jgi:hypothetical protein
MSTPEAVGFGKSVLELKRNLRILYPELSRPVGAAAICLGVEYWPSYHKLPYERRRSPSTERLKVRCRK